MKDSSINHTLLLPPWSLPFPVSYQLPGAFASSNHLRGPGAGKILGTISGIRVSLAGERTLKEQDRK